jgi:predicted regulator of Ras-like GTPase activity (Roadblock/LC7/MglB family)
MFGAIKKFFGHSAERVRGARVLTAPFRPRVRPSEAAKPAVSANVVTLPSPETPAPVASPEDCVTLTYQAILRLLPKELHGKNHPPASAKFSISKQEVLEQLPRGTVKVPFAELRRTAPPGVLAGGSAHDSQLVELPLRDILTQLKPEALPRRSQQRVTVPEEVSDLFGCKGERLSPVRVVARDEATRPVTPPTPPPAPLPARAVTPVVPPPAAPPAPASRAIPFPSPGRGPAAAPSSRFPKPGGPSAPGTVAFPAPAPAAPPPPPAKSPSSPYRTAPAAPAPTPAGAAPAGDGTTLPVPLSELSKGWPDVILREIANFNLSGANCELPVEEIDKGLRQGALRYQWKQIFGWIKGAHSKTLSPNSASILELPLSVVAPLYMARQRGAQPQRKVAVAEDIPDLFNADGVAAPATSEEPPTASPRPVAAPVAPPAAGPAASSTSEVLRLTVGDLCGNWPEAIRKEIDHFQIANAVVELPLDAVEAGIKLGRVDYLWKQLCQWMKPRLPAAVASVHGDTRLELPLDIVAPLFLEQRPSSLPQKPPVAIAIPEATGLGEAAPAARAPAPSSASSPVAAPPVKQAEDLAELFGEPDKRNWTPNEIVHKTSCLPDVAGALIALQDGLLVASCMPPPWRTETVAAFMPQIFGRMNQYAKELHMGELTSVSFTLDQGTLQIYNAGIIYFAALGKPGVPLPLANLNLIARELSRHTR